MNLDGIGRFIRERRKILGITQKDLAELSGVGINTVYKIELGQANPTIKTLMVMLDVLGLEMVSVPKAFGSEERGEL